MKKVNGLFGWFASIGQYLEEVLVCCTLGINPFKTLTTGEYKSYKR